jgi:hypothetical protein
LATCNGPYSGGDDIDKSNVDLKQSDVDRSRGDYPDPPSGEGGAASSGGSGNDFYCKDFGTHLEAQAFYESAGGPTYDPHWLDDENNGIACELLP